LKTITLTQGQTALIDDEDFPQISQHKWYAQYDKTTRSYYAARKIRLDDGRRSQLLMHRQLLGLKHGDKRKGDHIETSQTLDNRRDNLRIANDSQSNANRRKPRNNTSGYKGVWKDENRYVSMIRVPGGKRIYLGSRKTAEAAFFELYVPASLEHHGDFGRCA
jgi:hypothetical protein